MICGIRPAIWHTACIGWGMSNVTTVHADPAALKGVTKITIPGSQTAETAFFGADGLTFGDLVDAINPLNHIPIVSDLMNDGEASAPSTASNLLGGALLGG